MALGKFLGLYLTQERWYDDCFKFIDSNENSRRFGASTWTHSHSQFRYKFSKNIYRLISNYKKTAHSQPKTMPYKTKISEDYFHHTKVWSAACANWFSHWLLVHHIQYYNIMVLCWLHYIWYDINAGSYGNTYFVTKYVFCNNSMSCNYLLLETRQCKDCRMQ